MSTSLASPPPKAGKGLPELAIDGIVGLLQLFPVSRSIRRIASEGFDGLHQIVVIVEVALLGRLELIERRRLTAPRSAISRESPASVAGWFRRARPRAAVQAHAHRHRLRSTFLMLRQASSQAWT